MIERKIANARALDYPGRSPRGRGRLGRLARPDGGARPRGGRRPGPGAAARRQGGGAQPGRPPRRRARSWPSRTPTATGARTPSRRLVEPLRRRARRLRLRPGALRGRRGRQPGRPLLALRDGGALHGDPAGRDHRRERGIYAVRREAYIELDPSRGQDIGFPFELTKRGWRAVYEPAAVAEEKMAPTVEGEFSRKRRMMWGLWDVMLRWGMLDPRGYGPALRARDLLAPAAALPDALAAPGRLRGQHRAARPRLGLHRHAGAPARGAARRRCSGGSSPPFRSGSPTTTSP